MKILYIADSKVFGFGGGSNGERTWYQALVEYCTRKGDTLQVVSLDTPFKESFPVEVKKNRCLDIAARLCGRSSYIYWFWKKNRERIIEYAPDIVILGRSRMGAVAHDLKKFLPECQLICSFANIEYDYVEGYFANKGGLLGKAFAYLEKYCVKRDERESLQYADAAVFLTVRDLNRAKEFYNEQKSHALILPVCIESAKKLSLSSDKKAVVFVGSLSYASNIQALEWLISDVWKPYFEENKDLELIVGGSNPTAQLEKLLKSVPNCQLHKNFSKVEDIVPVGSLMVAPIQKGAGMKVKLAETLSMGLMIAASDEALAGYENALKSDQLQSILRANTAGEYKAAIESYMRKSSQELKMIESQNQMIWREFYSYALARKKIGMFLDEIRSQRP